MFLKGTEVRGPSGETDQHPGDEAIVWTGIGQNSSQVMIRTDK